MITHVAHTAVIVNNLDKSILFYKDNFNFILRFEGENTSRKMAFMYHKYNKSIEIELIQEKEEKNIISANNRINHIAFYVSDIESAISYYKKRGINFKTDNPKISIEDKKTIFLYGP